MTTLPNGKSIDIDMHRAAEPSRETLSLLLKKRSFYGTYTLSILLF